jgi:NRPS condensation-like uncharacterized protein
MPESIYKYKRKVTPFERVLSYSPFSIVTLVTRINGNITVDMLMNAIWNVQQRHTNLRVRIKKDADHNPWFTTDNVKEIPIEIITRESDDHWIQVQKDASQFPFRFDERPPIRFILLLSPNISELIILCHHIICDGLSLAYLAKDIMIHLGDPAKEAEILPNPAPIDLDNLPIGVTINPIRKFLINRINKRWKKERIHFDQEDYKNLNKAYWKKAKHQIISIELTETQTTNLVQRCRNEKVTVNSALTTAIVGAQQILQGSRKELSSLGIAGNLRDRLQKPPGEAMGFFAGVVKLDYTYDKKKEFWNNARRLNKKVQPLYTNKNLFEEGLTWCYLESGILEAINFKKLGGLVQKDFSRYKKLSAFSKRDDVISSILKREKIESLDKIIMGAAVTNLTRMDFPRKYGDLELDRIIMNPGGAFPLSNVNLVLGAVTCSGKLSLILEYDEGTVNTKTMTNIKDKAIEFLLNRENNTGDNLR